MTDRFHHIPKIDISAAYGDGRGKERLADDLREALAKVGFAYIANHRVPEDLVEDLRAEARCFFDLPPTAKQAITINRWHRGYMAPNSSTIVTSSVAEVSKPNRSESLLVMHELPADDPDLLADKPLQGPNQWPADQPALRPTALAYMAAMEDLARRLVRLIARGIGLEETALDSHFERPTVFLRLLHYPPQPAEEGLFGSAPHTDYGFLTLLSQDEVGGLEVRNRAGDWIAAPPIPGTFVLNVGDILARWSGRLYASTPHRVINRSGQARHSQPYFFDPSMDTLVAPLTPDSGTAFEPVRYGDYLMARIEKNYDYRKAVAG